MNSRRLLLFLVAQLQYKRREAVYIGKLKHDFNLIETEYITGSCSHADLAKKYGISKGVIHAYAREHDWTSKREQFLCDIYTESIQSKRAERIKTLEKIGDAANELAGLILKSTKAASDDIEKNGLTPNGLKLLTEALKNLEPVLRSAADMPTKIEQQKVDILKDKNKEDNIDKEIVVKFAPGPQEQQDQSGGGGD